MTTGRVVNAAIGSSCGNRGDAVRYDGEDNNRKGGGLAGIRASGTRIKSPMLCEAELQYY